MTRTTDSTNWLLMFAVFAYLPAWGRARAATAEKRDGSAAIELIDQIRFGAALVEHTGCDAMERFDLEAHGNLEIIHVTLVDEASAPPGCVVRKLERFLRYGSLCPECGGLPHSSTCGGGK